MVKDCKRPIQLDKGTASFPKPKEYQKMKVAGMELTSEESEESEESESDENSVKSSEESESPSKSDEEYLDSSGEELEQEQQDEGNWWDSPEVSD